MAFSKWIVSCKHGDGTPVDLELVGNHDDEASIKRHVVQHLPQLTFVSAKPAGATAGAASADSAASEK